MAVQADLHMSGPEYECTKCSRSYSAVDYEKDPYCPSCGTHLWRKSLSPEPLKVDLLFEENMNLEEIKVEGVCFSNVPLWMFARKRAYAKYRERFAVDKLREGENWRNDFRDFLHFKHNQSWSTLYRSGLEALSEPEKLRKLLVYLQDETIAIEKRVQEGLQGTYHCQGIGKNILTGLLHTFYPEKYGVWNNRTDETLKIIKRTPTTTFDAGRNYVAINTTLIKLAKELGTDLTTIDGFMWFISKE